MSISIKRYLLISVFISGKLSIEILIMIISYSLKINLEEIDKKKFCYLAQDNVRTMLWYHAR